VREGKYNKIGEKIGKREGVESTETKRIKNERYDYNQREKGNPMEYVPNKCADRTIFFFTDAELYSGLKNIVVTKCPNS
jgi:hypothetical protein